MGEVGLFLDNELTKVLISDIYNPCIMLSLGQLSQVQCLYTDSLSTSILAYRLFSCALIAYKELYIKIFFLWY